MKSCILLCAASLWASMACAEAPAGYYDSCEGKTKAALKSQLYTIVKDHTAISYGNGNDQTWGCFFDTDVHPDGYWWDIYTTNEVSVGTGAPDNNTMNKEHTFPKSWWGGNKNDAYKDIVHLMPTNSVANSTRSNWPYAEVASAQSISTKCPNPRFRHGTPVSGQGGGCNHVFEPDDEFKGDLARTYFYMVTCYQNLNWQGNGTYTAAQGSYPTLQPWAIEMLLRWHREDPVSQKERDRNDAVYKHQHNRNPFIDHPEMAEHIWGDKTEVAWSSSGTPVDPDPDPQPGEASLTSPIQGDWYKFTGVKPGQTLTMEIPLLGSGFTHNLTARIGGDAADLYRLRIGSLSLDAVSVNASDVESHDGYTLTVAYSPVAVSPEGGSDLATLTISCPDLEETVTVNLQGRCEAPVELDAVTVLPAEDITDEGYTVRWLPLAVEPDTYTVTRKVYESESDQAADTFTYEVDGSVTSLRITDRDAARCEAVSVTASLDGQDSPLGNEVLVQASGIGITESDILDGDARYFDTTGTELPGRPCSPGVYVVRIGGHTAKTVIIK